MIRISVLHKSYIAIAIGANNHEILVKYPPKSISEGLIFKFFPGLPPDPYL